MSGQRQNIPALSQGYQQRNSPQDNSRVFLSQANYGRLLQPLREHYEKKLGRPELPDNIDSKLQTRLQWYMDQVIKVNGANTPVNTLNQDAYRETMLNMDAWFQKQTSMPNPPIHRNTIANSANDRIFESVGSRFEKEQQSRAPPPAQAMLNSDFSLPTDDSDSEDPLDKYERLRKERESESAQIAKPKNIPEQYSEPSAQPATSMLTQQTNQSSPAPPLLGPRPQEYIIKQEDVVKYREIENNLFIYSGDRNWLVNRNENRYNFTINFNTVSSTRDKTFSPSVQSRFRNITRIELVKIIVSGESLEVTHNNAAPAAATALTVNTSRVTNILTYPYLMVHLDEWSSNSYGTNNNIDNCFAVVQYDQAWRPSQTSGASVSDVAGYVALTPRYLKSQRVYYPTPLATLQKLTLTVERPDGNPITKDLDTMDISGLVFLDDSINNQSADNKWIFINTKKYFSQFFALQGDRIVIQGYSLPSSTSFPIVTDSTASEFNAFINNSSGHIVVGVAWNDGLSLKSGPNTSGYANYIIIRNRYVDPTTGLTQRDFFGGSSLIENALRSAIINYSPSPCALLNTNRQSHFVLRIITREMDSTSNIRPDNS